MSLITYYFNSLGTPTNTWSDENNTIDNDEQTWGYTGTDNEDIVMDGNTCPGTNLGTITKVEVRALLGYAKIEGGGILFEPVFDGEHTGTLSSEYQATDDVSSDNTGSWSDYYDITSDGAGPGAGSWTWSDVVALDLNIYSEVNAGAKENIYCSKVEIRVTYTEVSQSTYTSFKTPQYSGSAHHVALGWTWASANLNYSSGMCSFTGDGTSWKWYVISSSSTHFYPSGDATSWVWKSGNCGL